MPADPFPYGSDTDPVEVRQGVVADENMLGQEELVDAEVNWAPPKEPYPKVNAAGFGGAVATVLIFLSPLIGVEPTAEVGAAFATIAAYGAAYIRTE